MTNNNWILKTLLDILNINVLLGKHGSTSISYNEVFYCSSINKPKNFKCGIKNILIKTIFISNCHNCTANLKIQCDTSQKIVNMSYNIQCAYIKHYKHYTSTIPACQGTAPTGELHQCFSRFRCFFPSLESLFGA